MFGDIIVCVRVFSEYPKFWCVKRTLVGNVWFWLRVSYSIYKISIHQRSLFRYNIEMNAACSLRARCLFFSIAWLPSITVTNQRKYFHEGRSLRYTWSPHESELHQLYHIKYHVEKWVMCNFVFYRNLPWKFPMNRRLNSTVRYQVLICSLSKRTWLIYVLILVLKSSTMYFHPRKDKKEQSV